MSSKYILQLQEVTKENIDLVGGKGANLGEMSRAGLPVPEGFCIQIEAYKDFMKETGIQLKIEKALIDINWDRPDKIERIAQQIKEWIINGSLSDVLERDILKAYKQLGNNKQEKEVPVAVRSSATAEDLPDASFAGQQETFLYTRGKEEVIRNVKNCWASLWSARAMVYRQKKNYHHVNVYLAVIIQKMVDSEVAGVAFTVNPLTEKDNEMLINSAYGLGEVVVAGTVTPDSFVISKKDGSILQKQLGSKEKQLISDLKGQTVLLGVPQNRQDIFSLTDHQLLELRTLTTKIEAHYQYPQDVEWAFANEKLYLLQTRPITTLGQANSLDESISFEKLSKFQRWMMDDLIEHYPQAPSPLDYSVVTMSYQSILDCAERLGLKISRAEKIISFENGGKIHLNPPKVKLTSKILQMPATLIKAAKVSIDDWKHLKQEVKTTVEWSESSDLIRGSNEQLLRKWKDTFDLAKMVTDLRFFYITIASIIPFAALSFLIKKKSGKLQTITPIELVTTGLEYQTVVIDRELNQLAVFASHHMELKAMILQNESKNLTEFHESLLRMSIGEEFWNKLQIFLKKYGYRTEKMYQPFASKAWLEDSSEFLNILRAVIQDPLLTERAAKEAKRKSEYEELVKEYEKKIRGPFRQLFKWSLQRLKLFHVMREETVYYLEMLFTAGRKLSSEFGKRLTNMGLLQSPEEIIYLQKDEIEKVLYGTFREDQIRLLLDERIKNALTNQLFWRQCLLKLSEQKIDGESVVGIIGSPGLVEGPVRIVMSVGDFQKLKKGDILICPYTDPTWTPLFGIASAVVADTGGPLSHAAIVAREYGIPAILGTKMATMIFKDGDQVIVDGTSGKVFKKI